MWHNLIDWFKRLFGRKQTVTTAEMQRNELFAARYNDPLEINVTAMISNKISGVTIFESAAHVVDKKSTPSKRVQLLDDTLAKFWNSKFKKLLADMMGNGGMFVIPYIYNGKLAEDVIPQSRVAINSAVNGQLYSISAVMECKTIGLKEYFRVTDLSLEGSVYTIRQKAVDAGGGEVPLSVIDEWAGLTPEYSISNCDRLPVAFFKCPTSTRNIVTNYGVPITFGQNKLIEYINGFIDMFVGEYKNKRPFVGIDDRLFGKNNELPDSGIFKKLRAEDNTSKFFEIFDPAIRDNSIINGLNFLFDLLENGVGLSKGVLTKLESIGATATEIKAAQRDTAVFVDSVRKMCDTALDDLVYAYNILSEHWQITPAAEYNLVTDWDYSFLESSSETFNQLVKAQEMGAVKLSRLNQYVTGQTEGDAEEEIAYVKESEPTINQLIGG